MKKTITSWVFGIIVMVIFVLIRFVLGYQSNPAWYWILIVSLVSLQVGKFLYYVMFGANIDQITYQEPSEDEQEFTFKFNPQNLSQTEYGLGSFDPESYPELKDPRILQQILYGQTTRKEIRTLTDNQYARDIYPTKDYKYRGKTYTIKFYPRPITPGMPPLGKQV